MSGINRVTTARGRALFPPGSKRRADVRAAAASLVVGDVHPEVAEVAGALTPVPGGVGPLTIAMLLRIPADGGRAEAGRRRDLVSRLTGGIATGKSHVLAASRPGAACRRFDANPARARRRSHAGAPAVASCRRARFGDEILAGRRRVDRREARRHRLRRSFARAATSRQSSIPPSIARSIAGLRAFEPPASALAVVDIPLLYETGTRRTTSIVVIVAACPPEEQLRAADGARSVSNDEARSAARRADGRLTRKSSRRLRDLDDRHVEDRTADRSVSRSQRT